MLVEVLVQVAAVVTLLLVVFFAVIVGRYRLRETRREWLSRVREVAPAMILLVAVLSLNGVARRVVPDISWMIRDDVTGLIYDLEGEFVVWVQSFATPTVTAFFSFVYVYGYVFLLIFPIVAYFALPNTRPLRVLISAYTLNYALGLVLYVFVIAYGPRNLMPELVQVLLYDTYPQYQHLTRQVNRNTNVFPSLHTSMAATVAILSYHTREIYPTWFALATALAVSVAISTMYLGIHWAIDVIAGVALAYVSVVLSVRLVDRWSLSEKLEGRLPTSLHRG